MTITRQTLYQIISFLDDSDKDVVRMVATHLLEVTLKEYATVEEIYSNGNFSDNTNYLLEQVLQKARSLNVSERLKELLTQPQLDWVELLNVASQLQYANISSAEERLFIKGLVNAVELELTPTQLNKTKVFHLSKVIHAMYDFKSCSDSNASEPNSLFFNDFLSIKKGNRLLLSLLYFVIARQVKLPLIPYQLGNEVIFGVPVQSPIIAIKNIDKPLNYCKCKIEFFIMPSQDGKKISYSQIAQEIEQRYLHIEDELILLSEHALARFYIKQLASAYEKNKHFAVAEELYSVAAEI